MTVRTVKFREVGKVKVCALRPGNYADLGVYGFGLYVGECRFVRSVGEADVILSPMTEVILMVVDEANNGQC